MALNLALAGFALFSFSAVLRLLLVPGRGDFKLPLWERQSPSSTGCRAGWGFRGRTAEPDSLRQKNSFRASWSVRAPLFPLLFFVLVMELKPPLTFWNWFKLPGCAKGGVLKVLKASARNWK